MTYGPAKCSSLASTSESCLANYKNTSSRSRRTRRNGRANSAGHTSHTTCDKTSSRGYRPTRTCRITTSHSTRRRVRQTIRVSLSARGWTNSPNPLLSSARLLPEFSVARLLFEAARPAPQVTVRPLTPCARLARLARIAAPVLLRQVGRLAPNTRVASLLA